MGVSFTKDEKLIKIRQKNQFFLTVLTFLFMMILIFPLQGIAQPIYSGPAFGQITGGVQVSTTAFPKMPDSSQLPGLKPIPERLPQQYIDDKFNKTSAAGPLGSNIFTDPITLLGVQQTVQAPGVVVDFEGFRDPGGYIPPDPDVAAGPDHVILVENMRFIIFDKKGNKLQTILSSAWFSSTIANPVPFDCIIIYDHFEDRWVQLWLTLNEVTQSSYWLLSVSDDADPMGTWYNFAFPSHFLGSNNGFAWGDYPKLGYDQQALYVSGRHFFFAGGFAYSKVRIIPKSQLYDPSAGPVDYTDLWNFKDPNNPAGQAVDGPPVAAMHFDSTQTAYLVVDSPYFTSTFVTLWEYLNHCSFAAP
jgi:hypothetical protein